MTEAWQWHVFPADLDPARGSEQRGRRPVVVVSLERTNRRLQIVTILPLTSVKPGRPVHYAEVLVRAGTAGLPQDSIVMAHQVRTVAKERLGEEYGQVADLDLREQIRDKLKLHLDLEDPDAINL